MGEETTLITFTPDDEVIPIPVIILKDTNTEIDEVFNLLLQRTLDSQEYGVRLAPSTISITIKEENGKTMSINRVISAIYIKF